MQGQLKVHSGILAYRKGGRPGKGESEGERQGEGQRGGPEP